MPRLDNLRRLSGAWVLAGTACVYASAAGCASPIDDDENVILFPTFAVEDGASSWIAHIRGWIFEPEVGEKRLFLLGELEKLLRNTFGLRQEELESKPATLVPHFAERAGMFLADNERRERLVVTIAGDTFTLGRSEPDGHFEGGSPCGASPANPASGLKCAP